MSIASLCSRMQSYAKDIKINLKKVLDDDSEGAPGLSQEQVRGVALAVAYTTKSTAIVKGLLAEWQALLTEEQLSGIKAAVSVMGMNNIYYRFIHTVNDKSYGAMPAGLRMQVVANPGIDKVDFELYCLAVSVVNYCDLCMNSHVKAAEAAGVNQVAIQSVVRISAVVKAAADVLAIEGEG